MAQQLRKLFPINVTDCQTFPCDPFCPSAADCYPDFLFPLLPPPPPPPPPPPHSSNSAFTLSPYIIVSLSLFALISVLAASYVVIVKRCFRRRSGARADDRLDFLDHNQGPEIDHPIWYINSIGLHPSVINSIAVFKYKRGDAPIEGSVCSVCLSEFGDDETLRLLPKCNHAFHIACIDTWLRSHTNCPLCRAGILSNTTRAPSNETSNENTNSGNNVEGRGNLGIDNENREETEAGIGSSDSKEISDATVVSMTREKGRRSVSMDSLIGVADFSNEQLRGNLVKFSDDNHNYGTNRTRGDGNLRIGSSSSAESLHMSPVSMKRSFSCSGRLFSSSRYGNKSSSSILPL